MPALARRTPTLPSNRQADTKAAGQELRSFGKDGADAEKEQGAQQRQWEDKEKVSKSRGAAELGGG